MLKGIEDFSTSRFTFVHVKVVQHLEMFGTPFVFDLSPIDVMDFLRE